MSPSIPLRLLEAENHEHFGGEVCAFPPESQGDLAESGRTRQLRVRLEHCSHGSKNLIAHGGLQHAGCRSDDRIVLSTPPPERGAVETRGQLSLFVQSDGKVHPAPIWRKGRTIVQRQGWRHR